MICENCGKDNKDTSRFCSECGKALIDKPIELDLQQIKIPAVSRKPKIIKVNTKNSEEKKETPETDVNSLFLPKEDADEMVTIPPLDTGVAESEPEPEVAEETAPQAENAPAEIPKTDKPMSIGAWIGTFIITAIPFVNIIMLLVWAIGKNTNKSKKSYAAAVLIISVIAAVLSAVAVFVLMRFTKFNPTDFFNNKF